MATTVHADRLQKRGRQCMPVIKNWQARTIRQGAGSWESVTSFYLPENIRLSQLFRPKKTHLRALVLRILPRRDFWTDLEAVHRMTQINLSVVDAPLLDRMPFDQSQLETVIRETGFPRVESPSWGRNVHFPMAPVANAVEQLFLARPCLDRPNLVDELKGRPMRNLVSAIAESGPAPSEIFGFSFSQDIVSERRPDHHAPEPFRDSSFASRGWRVGPARLSSARGGRDMLYPGVCPRGGQRTGRHLLLPLLGKASQGPKLPVPETAHNRDFSEEFLGNSEAATNMTESRGPWDTNAEPGVRILLLRLKQLRTIVS